MDLGKYFSGFFTHSLTRSVNENQGSFEDRESHFLLVLKRNSDGDKIYKGLKETNEFNIYELTDLNSPRNLIYLVISLRFTNEKISIKAEELQPNRNDNLFWGDWPPSYSWVFFLGNILFYEISQFEFWENVVINLIALHNGESLFELYEKSTRVFSISGSSQSKKKDQLESPLERIHENEQYSSIPRLFNILCEWCDYFGPNIMTIFWLLLVFFIISILIFCINIIALFGYFISIYWLNYKNPVFNFTFYSKKITPYLILMIPIITSIGLIFLKSILDDFPLPKHNQEYLIYFSNNTWRNPVKKKPKEYLNLFYHMAIPILIISIYVPFSNKIEILKNEFFKFMVHFIFSSIIFQIVNNINMNIDVSRETKESFWSFKLPLIIKNIIFFIYWKIIKQISIYFSTHSIDYFPFAIALTILAKNLFSVINSIPYSKNCIGFKLGPKEEMKRLPLGDYVTYNNDLAIGQSSSVSNNFWNNLFFIKNKYTLYEDMWHYNLINMILLSICTEYPIITSFILMLNSGLTIILLFSKILTDSTRPWLLIITLSHQLWKFIIDSNILFSISCFSSTPTSSNFKTSLFIVTFILNYVNINTSKSGKMIYLSENLVFYIFKLVPLFKYTRQAIEKNKMSLNKAINKVLRMRNPQIINNNDDGNLNLIFNKQKENGYSNIRTIEITSPLKELLEKFQGYWVLLRSNSDSLQEINAALGVSWFIRRAVDKLNPIVHYDVDTVRGIVSISTTLIMGLNNRTTLIINRTKNLGKNNLEEIENHRIEKFKMEEENDNLSLSHDEGGLYRQYSNKRKKSLEKYMVFEQPNTTLEWSEDRTNIILETRQNREGFKMIETRSIVPSYKLPFKVKGNDGKIIENRRQDILCYKIILKGGKRNFNNKNNLLVCCRYFIKTEIIKSKDSDSNSKESSGSKTKSDQSKSLISVNSLNEIQSKESVKPIFIGELNEFPLTVQQLIEDEDSIFKIVTDKRAELLEYTRKLVSEIDNGTQKWSLERNSNGMRVYKKEVDGQPFMSCGITSISLNCNIEPFKISSDNNEIENTNKICSIKDIVDYIWDSNNKMYYDPMVEKSDPMHYFRNDENICIFYQAFKGQWGVSGRDFVVICYRYKPDANESTNSDESQYEYILTQSIEWPIINSSYVRAKNYFATYVFRPEGENKVQAIYFNQVDLHTDISAWIIKRVILDQMNSLTMLRDILQKK
ncbi:START domain protein [Cryptosporidium hominis]|nr:putative integral membrane protein [Cryptosporidium hominis]PPA64798.1 START domain protein [Cryptosporidium hominis]